MPADGWPRLALLAGCVVLAACGGSSSPTSPSSSPQTSGRVVGAVSGAGVAGVDIYLGFGLPAATSDGNGYFLLSGSATGSFNAKLSAAGIVERQTRLRIPGGDTLLSVIPSSFDLSAFDEMMRPNGALQRWVTAPTVVVQTRVLTFTAPGDEQFRATSEELTQEEVAGLIKDLNDGLAQLTGGKLGSFAQVLQESAEPGSLVSTTRAGMITVARYDGLSHNMGNVVGWGRWAVNERYEVTGGAIMLDRALEVSGSSYRRLVRIHELGHALGYGHVTLRASVMNSPSPGEANEWDRAAVAIAFQRPPGNRAPDADPAGYSANLVAGGRPSVVIWGPILP